MLTAQTAVLIWWIALDCEREVLFEQATSYIATNYELLMSSATHYDHTALLPLLNNFVKTNEPFLFASVEKDMESSSAFLPPLSSGHSCTVMLSDMLVVVGGRSQMRSFSCSNLSVCHLKQMKWSVIENVSSAPTSLFYHVAAPLSRLTAGESIDTGPRYLMAVGGVGQPRKDEANDDT